MNSFKNITPDDPRLTAYALGELTDEAEKKAVEQAIANDPQLAATVDDIRATAELLGNAFSEDTHLGEPPAIETPEADVPEHYSSRKVVRFPAWLGLAAAAAVAATVGVVTVMQEEPRVREVGQLAPREVDTVTLAEAEGLAQTQYLEPSQAFDYVPPELENPPRDRVDAESPLAGNGFQMKSPSLVEERSLLEIETAPEQKSVFVDGVADLGVDADSFAVDEAVPAPRPKVQRAPSPIVIAEAQPVSTESVLVTKPATDGLSVSGNVGYESQHVFRGKQLSGPMVQAGAGVSVRPGAAETDDTVEATFNSNYAQPASGDHYAMSDISVGKNLGDTGKKDARDYYYDVNMAPAVREPELPEGGEIAAVTTAPAPATVPNVSTRMQSEEAKLEQPNLSKSATSFFGIKSNEEAPAEEKPDSASAMTPENQKKILVEVKDFWARSAFGARGELVPAARGWQRPDDPSLPPDHPYYRQQRERSNTEGYLPVTDNAFESPLVEPLSTFSIDVDTASYANVRRFIDQGQLPPPDAVRIEELINYFPYDYKAPGPEAEHPLACYVDAAPAPWAPEHRLVRVGMKAQEIAWEERPSSNLVFLIDVSGSMNRPNKLPLVKDALAKLIRRLDGRDRVAIVVYAGASGLVLPSTTANNSETIQFALDNLKAGGSTNGGQGLLLAYKVAKDNLLKDGNNRVILCTDGDFNVGTTDKGQIATLAEVRAKEGIYLTVLGFGMGNLKDDMLETLSNRGNGNYGYIDSEREARKVFVEQAAGTLLTVAKDVKIQVEFNPAVVQAYRLIGYENRKLAARDFNDDTKDAGEVGAGHSVTALYEIVPVGVEVPAASPESVAGIDPLKYQGESKVESRKSKVTTGGRKMDKDEASEELSSLDFSLLPNEMLTVKIRYKLPDSNTSTKLEFPLGAEKAFGGSFDTAPVDFRFAAAVAEFGMVLRGSPYKGTSTLTAARNIAEGSLGSDPGGHRGDFVDLVEKAIRVKGEETPQVPGED